LVCINKRHRFKKEVNSRYGMSEGHPHQWQRAKGVRIHCKDCIAECCKHIALPIDEPTTQDDWQEIVNWLHHEGVSVYLDVEDDWLVDIKLRCNNLDDNKCKVWGTTEYPTICANYDMDTCVMNEPGNYWKILFDTPEQAAEYARKKGMTKPLHLTKPKNCHDECCNHIIVPLEEPEDGDDFDDFKWYIYHQGVIIYKDEDDNWYAEIKTRRREPCSICDEEACIHDENTEPVVLCTIEDINTYCQQKNIDVYKGKKPKLQLSSY